MFNFGAGRARLIPLGGGQPVELGVVQSGQLQLKVDLKELRGPYRYPITVADGKGTASGKVNFAAFWPATLAAILGASVTAQAGPQAAIAENQTIPAVTTYTVTLTNATTLVAGSEIVTVIVNGAPVYYTRVTAGSEAAATATNPLGGKYSINNATGVLTFVAADASRAVQITYLYTPASNPNATIALQQIGMNSATTFQLTLIGNGRNPYTNAAQQIIVNLNACLAPSLSLNMKLDDFTDLDLDFQAFIDASGNLGSIYLVNPTNG